MKKFGVIILFGLLILAFSTTGNTEEFQFKASGYLATVGVAYRNIEWPVDPIYGPPPAPLTPEGPGVPPASSGTYNKTYTYWHSRGRLKFDAIVDKNLKGTFHFELDGERWGGTGDGRNKLGYWTADRASVEVKNVYVDAGLPYFGIPVPINLRVGLQPLGTRQHIFMYTDGMGINAGFNIAPLLVSLTWAKAWEGNDASSDDVDIYGLDVNLRTGAFKVGTYAFYFNMNTYPFTEILPYGVKPTNKADMYWFGVYADGKLIGLDVNFDFVYDTGKVKPNLAKVPDVDYNGWATRLRVAFPFNKFNIGLIGFYASGADLKKTSGTGLPGSKTPSGTFTTEVNSFVIPPGSEAYRTFGESLVFYGMGEVTLAGAGSPGFYVHPSAGGNSQRMTRGTQGGSWFAKLFGTFKATPWYLITLQGLYIGDTASNGNTIGDARRSDGRRRDDRTIGWEIDLINDFQIYRNLNLLVGAGVLFAGDAMDRFNIGTGKNTSPKDPWVIGTKLIYTF